MQSRQPNNNTDQLVRRIAVCAVALLAGCTAPLFRGQNPEKIEEFLENAPRTTLVGDLAGAWGHKALKVESVALVTNLANTGSDPPPSPIRDTLKNEMQTHEVPNPNQLLASPTTSLVMVRGYVPVGAQTGDRFDLEVYTPARSETTSLRGGWLMQTRLREYQTLNNSVKSGHIVALADGQLVVDAVFDGQDDKVAEVRGRVLGGGLVRTPRPIGLRVHDDHTSVKTSVLIGNALNSRFHTFDRGIKKGVATPKNDRFIELAVPAKYKHNLARYVRVARSVAVGESPADRAFRLTRLERMLVEPTTSATAALQLEAIGREGVPILKKGVQTDDAEVRFYSAEALAYLEEPDAAGPLAEFARADATFRWHALAALAAMDDVRAYDALTDLLGVQSVETRYGAFRAMQVRNPRDPLVAGDILADKVSLHLISTPGEPLIHFSRSRRPEVVVLGHDQVIASPTFLFAGKEIMLKALDAEHLQVTRFAPGKDDRRLTCSNRVDAVVRAIVEVGGGYGEVYQALRDAKDRGFLQSRIVVDAMPKPRQHTPKPKPTPATPSTPSNDESNSDDPPTPAGLPLPDLFYGGFLDSKERTKDWSKEEEKTEELAEPKAKKKGFLGKLTGR